MNFYRMRPRLRRPGSLSTATVTIAHLILVAWCAFRLAVLGKATVEIPSLSMSSERLVSWLLLTLVALETLVMFVVLIRTKALPSYALVGVDAALSAVVSITPAFQYSEVGDSLLPWHFALVFTSICLVAMRTASARWTTVIVVFLTATYLAGRFTQSAWASPAVAVASAFTVSMVFAVGATASRHLIALGDRMEALVESNVKLAARVAVANERATQRVFLHDTAGLLAMIANTEDPELSAVLRERARSTSKELRAYVYQERHNEAGPTRPLDQVLERIAAEFRDLPIDQNTLLAKNVFLSGDATQATESALRTLLDNIRVHAHARSVTIHARATVSGWEVTVRDDGVGFDPAKVRKGFGLREQVESQCALAGITVTLNSFPGEGTEVRLAGSGFGGTQQPKQSSVPRTRGMFSRHWRESRRSAGVRK